MKTGAKALRRERREAYPWGECVGRPGRSAPVASTTMTLNEYQAFRRFRMSKWNDFLVRVDEQETRIDERIDAIRRAQNTARIGCAVVIFLAAMGLLLWVW